MSATKSFIEDKIAEYAAKYGIGYDELMSSFNAGSTCLKTINGKTVDLRGDDGEHCKLYKFGTRKTASLPGEL